MATFSLVALILGITAPDYAITWDELIYHEGARSCAEWFRALGLKIFGAHALHPLSRETLERVWNPYYHPPLVKVVDAAFWGVLHSSLGDLLSMRMAACFMAALVPAGLVAWLWPRVGPWPSLVAGWGYALSPRLFSEAHMVSLDMPTAMMWFFCVLAFLRTDGSRKRWGVATALFALTLGTKLVGFFLPFPLLLWVVCVRGRKSLPASLAIFGVGTLLFLTLWPYLWPSPIENFIGYLKLYLSKKQIPTFYGGQAYAEVPPPWHYPFVMSAVCMPVWWILLVLFGAIQAIRKPKSEWIAVLLAGLTPLLVVALPGAPKYDGIRLLQPAFPCLAALVGLGVRDAMVAVQGWTRFEWLRRMGLGTVLFGALLGSQVLAIAIAHPTELSFYNALVGGPSGAHRLGFESTYWGDAFTPRFLSRVNQKLPQDSKIKFLPMDQDYGPGVSLRDLNAVPHAIRAYTDQGQLRSDLRAYEDPPYDFVLLHFRQGFFDAFCWQLVRERSPILSETYQGVLLAAVYDLRDLPEEARSLRPWGNR